MIKFKGKVVKGSFIKRYKRFFVDAKLENGEVIVAHTPNTGSMKGLLIEGSAVLLSYDPNPKRKLDYSLQAICSDGAWVGVNTQLPNALITQAIENGEIEQLTGYEKIKREVKYGREGKSRIDVFLSEHKDKKPDVFVEVKNVTLKENGCAMFPDAVTKRGLKHLEELIDVVKNGDRAMMIFLVQRTDCNAFRTATKIDRDYAEALKKAKTGNVEIICLVAHVNEDGVELSGSLPIYL